MATLSPLQARIEKARELLPFPHLLPPDDGESFLSLRKRQNMVARLRVHFKALLLVAERRMIKQRKTDFV